MALGKENAAPIRESTDERAQKIRAHVHKMIQKMVDHQAMTAKKH